MPTKDTITAMAKREELLYSLYERFSEKVLSQALFYCGTKQEAEDCVQDVFLKVWKDLHRLQVKIKNWDEWRSFLFVSTRNRASNLLRGRKRNISFLEGYSMSVTNATHKDWTLEKECDRIFMNAISELSSQQKEIFVLKYYGFKPRIIAKKLRLKPGTISNTLLSSRKILADRVSKLYEIDEPLVKLVNEISR
jgi:RNA polymerase sigma-70 factor (ECF subfamily)